MTRKRITITALAAAGIIAAGLGAAHLTAASSPRPCTFDGGGTIASGDAARTTEGTTWVCTDGTLIKVTRYGN